MRRDRRRWASVCLADSGSCPPRLSSFHRHPRETAPPGALNFLPHSDKRSQERTPVEEKVVANRSMSSMSTSRTELAKEYPDLSQVSATPPPSRETDPVAAVALLKNGFVWRLNGGLWGEVAAVLRVMAGFFLDRLAKLMLHPRAPPSVKQSLRALGVPEEPDRLLCFLVKTRDAAVIIIDALASGTLDYSADPPGPQKALMPEAEVPVFAPKAIFKAPDPRSATQPNITPRGPQQEPLEEDQETEVIAKAEETLRGIV